MKNGRLLLTYRIAKLRSIVSKLFFYLSYSLSLSDIFLEKYDSSTFPSSEVFSKTIQGSEFTVFLEVLASLSDT